MYRSRLYNTIGLNKKSITTKVYDNRLYIQTTVVLAHLHEDTGTIRGSFVGKYLVHSCDPKKLERKMK